MESKGPGFFSWLKCRVLADVNVSFLCYQFEVSTTEGCSPRIFLSPPTRFPAVNSPFAIWQVGRAATVTLVMLVPLLG